MTFLTSCQWRESASSQRSSLSPFLEEHLERRRRGQKHPVWDFLFEYYSFKPALLSRFSSGVGVELEGGEELLSRPEWKRTARGVTLDVAQFPPHRLRAAHEILALLESTHGRPARHDCFGWHEWAMVYRSEETRHSQPLRLSGGEIAALLEEQTLRCSHYDAVRFWTPDALPLNILAPQPHDREEWEQPGCVHANMDLYKWSAKFAPWIASELVVDAFLLAKEARVLDMRASPYDLQAFGFEPIRLETSEGRREYAGLQREVAMLAAPIRARLIEAYRALLQAVDHST